ncbi:MAG: efflux RND transporter permease subunit [Candidatus Tectomicrobia bacterium]|nr:efflux RND transporter permease subunit [Candidatus Tectomicrobia bacterium]
MKRLIALFVRNRVMANILMWFFILVGVISLFQIRSELIPQFSLDRLQVQVVWEGASPEEAEEGVCIKIEEALTGIEGVKTVISTALEHNCRVIAELQSWVKDRGRVMDDVKSAVDRIDTFPEGIERPVVTEIKRLDQVLDIALYGDVPEVALKRVAEEVKEDLLAIPGISQVVIRGLREWEIAVEVPEAVLRAHGLTFERLADTIRKNVLELSGGDIRSPERRIRIRTLGKRYTGREFEELPILTRPDGAILRLGEIARVVDGLEESDKSGRFNGKPAALIVIYKTDEEDALKIAASARQYIQAKRAQLPAGLHLDDWADTSRLIQDRFDLLMRNARSGLILIFLTLWLFMNIRLSFWVAMGLPVAVMGALGFITFSGGTLNMITLFAFIMVIGMLVDDAIVVSENIYTRMKAGEDFVTASVEGCAEVAIPVISTITTTVIAFLPLLFMEGTLGKFMAIMPIGIIASLVASLFESLFILPAHLAHWFRFPQEGTLGSRLRGRVDEWVDWVVGGIYAPSLRFCLEARYLVAAVALALFFVTVSLAAGGHVRFLFFPRFDSDWVEARLLFPEGTPIEQTTEAARRIERAAMGLNAGFKSKSGAPIIKHVFTVLGEQVGPNLLEEGSHAAQVIVEMLPSELRGISSTEILNRWREKTGAIPDTISLTFQIGGAGPPGGKPIEVQFAGQDTDALRRSADALKNELRKYPGVYDIEDDFRAGKIELRTVLTPQGRLLGVSLQDLATQLRARFFGLEALRLQRGREDVKVKVRYPPEERQSLGDVEKARIRTPAGAEIPFYEVAEADIRRGLAQIKRVDRKRVVTVIAEVDEVRANPTEILDDLRRNFFPALVERHPGIRLRFEGQAKESRESVGSLRRGFLIALAGIFVNLAIMFRSYFQPLVVMSAIPFGVVGAIWGHILMGLDISIMSLMGFVALSGVVVNDSLVLLDFVNRKIAAGAPVEEALQQSGVARWRPILMTTLTTVAGLAPLVAERSFQAQFLIPMAVSMCFGLLFSTAITLILVPVLVLIGNDMVRLFWRGWLGRWPSREEVDVHSPEALRAGGLRPPAHEAP